MAGFGTGIAAQLTGAGGGMTTGIDVQVSIVDSLGNPIDYGGEVIDFQAQPNISTIESRPISNGGEPDYKKIPNGWHGTLTIDRYNGALDLLQAANEELFHTRGITNSYKIIERKRDDSGLIRKFQYIRAVLELEDPGSHRIDAAVPMKLTFSASRKLLIP